MGQTLLILVVALTVAAVVFGVTVLISGRDGLAPAEPDGRAVPLPGGRPLRESDVGALRFDTALRGYRMDQVDQAMRRAGYDIGYKTELIGVLEAEIAALREGRTADADALRRTREEAARTATDASPTPADAPADPDGPASGAAPTEPAAEGVRPSADAGPPAAATGDATPTDGRAGDDRAGEPAGETDADRPGGAVVRPEPV
ncbi:DivIVA domain-containing protein [Micromonospora sp. HUAS LYJ1]|uniref:DivIVA domain-containing protein n=1 Tax=Micromonospora sp. HUAS LYJ1 TaxID=3061626 RepID=UPI0026718853|nr:DivIVA domain-containing protein [Micromonospora sp. HUAS LYJ1]WKU04031.1 DivIVA domain-containing protein [Micromonospora sp. HUAS LYJ1]